jgi:hypothetical protein
LRERLRRQLTSQHLFRCHHCDWRGWEALVVDESSATIVAEENAPDLTTIDDTLKRPVKTPDAAEEIVILERRTSSEDAEDA